MPYSSRRKQSKPQHLLNEGVEEQDMPTAGSQKVTSSHDTTAGEPVTQEGHYGSMLTDGETRKNGAHNEVGHFSNFKQNSESDNGFDTSDSDGEETEIIVRDIANHYPEQNDTDSMPHDLSLKNKVADSEIENDFDLEDEGQEGDGMLPVFTSPSELLTDRFCVYCNVVKKSPADLERHLRKHTGDRPFHCQECTKSFKSKRSLQYHQYMSHGTEPDDSNIAQRYQLLRKRRLEEQNKLDHSQSNPSGTFEPITSSSSTYLSGSPANLNTSPSSHIDTSASKRQKIDELTSPHSQYIGAITPTSSSDLTFDLQIARSIEKGMKSLSSDGGDGQDLTRACPVCAKAFPKPSDLKRHMMCHTGEKPFRCQYCNKPFRAKSSMHYHLKATHGVEIELSPGLEERYMRMKTRAQMNFIQRGHLTGVTYPFNSEASELPQYQRDNIDIDEIEEDTKSTDSSYFHNSGIGSEFSDAKSQGHYSNTGIYEKTAVDLSISGNGCGKLVGEAVITGEAPFQKNKISIQNETVLITRLDGLDLLNGECSSIYKCYLCGKMFSTLSKMQCHLSLHFEKQMVKFECCFCDELFQFKTQMKNHIRRKHNGQFNGKFDVTNQDKLNEGKNSFSSNSNGLPEKASLLSKSADNQFSCRYCRKTFSKKISLHKHMRLHFWNKNCFCRICGKSFNQYTSLQLHISRFHWKSAGKTSWLRQKYNFFNSNRFKQNSHDGIPKQDSSFPLNLIKPKIYQNAVQASLPHSDVTVVMPQSPPLDNGDISDAATSHHSSENNWSESLSDNTVLEIEDGGIEIRTAPKRLLLPVRRGENSPKSKSSRKSTPTHLQTQNLPTSDNNVPLNFIKTEALHQDNNNNEPPHESNGHLSPEGQSQVPNLESIAPGYSMNATSQLLMAKALAAHKAHQSLNQQLNHTSQPMIFPPNHLPPNLAAMTGMMTLPVSIQVPVTETRTGTSKSPSPASHTSSKSDTSPDDRDGKEISRDSLLGYPRVQWGQNRTGPDWTFNMYCPTESNHTDGRKVTSLSRTHSRLGIVHSPINREAMCKPTQMPDGRTVYKCPFCSKEFLSFSDINRHMDFHEDDKRRESTLLSAPKNRNKLSSDLDIRPYKCQYCDYFARTNSQLKVHMMRHQGIREFCCKLCNYKGVTQSDLNRHMKSQIHMLKSRNACKYCGEGFVTGKNLEKHLDGNCIVKMQKLNGGLDLPLQESLA